MKPVVVFPAKLINPKLTGPTTAQVTGLDPKTGRVAVTINGRQGVLQAKQILSANVDAWKAGLRWAPKYWRTGLNENMQDWGDVPEDRRAKEETTEKSPFDDVPDTLSLADFPGTPGPDHGRR